MRNWYRSGVVTTPFVSPEDIKKTLGLVTATVARGPGFWGQLLVDFHDSLGGRSNRVEDLFDQMREEVISRLYDRAARLGANAVIGINVSIHEFGNKVFVLSAVGTAAVTG